MMCSAGCKTPMQRSLKLCTYSGIFGGQVFSSRWVTLPWFIVCALFQCRGQCVGFTGWGLISRDLASPGISPSTLPSGGSGCHLMCCLPSSGGTLCTA